MGEPQWPVVHSLPWPPWEVCGGFSVFQNNRAVFMLKNAPMAVYAVFRSSQADSDSDSYMWFYTYVDYTAPQKTHLKALTYINELSASAMMTEGEVSTWFDDVVLPILNKRSLGL